MQLTSREKTANKKKVARIGLLIIIVQEQDFQGRECACNTC